MDAARGLRFAVLGGFMTRGSLVQRHFLSDVLFVVSSKRTMDSTYDFFCGTVVDIV
jgi:hypothetical protein